MKLEPLARKEQQFDANGEYDSSKGGISVSPPPFSLAESNSVKRTKTESGPEILPMTALNTPDGSGRQRTRIGVGERMSFSADIDGKWSHSDGDPIGPKAGNTFQWKAPNYASRSKISLSTQEGSSELEIDVIEPTYVEPIKINEIDYNPGEASAGMIMHFDYHPMSVSFANIEEIEQSGPATNVSGYFAQWPEHLRFHQAGSHWVSVNHRNRSTVNDRAYANNLEKPWSDGSMDWIIPNRFRVKGESGLGKVFDHVTQSFTIKADGEVTIKKGNESVTRKP